MKDSTNQQRVGCKDSPSGKHKDDLAHNQEHKVKVYSPLKSADECRQTKPEGTGKIYGHDRITRFATKDKIADTNIQEEIPTYCNGCSFKCQATECDCICHDKMREYWKSNSLHGVKSARPEMERLEGEIPSADIDIQIIKAKMFDRVNKNHIELVRWLYNNYLPILREWESTQGNLRIEFAEDKVK